jgi:hypothetical protein
MGINNKLTLRTALNKRLRKLCKRLHKLRFMLEMLIFYEFTWKNGNKCQKQSVFCTLFRQFYDLDLKLMNFKLQN